MAKTAIHRRADIVENTERAEEADVLECAGNAEGGDAVGLLIVERDAIEADRPARGFVNAGDDVEDRRLPRPVWADEADHLLRGDVKIQIADGAQAAKFHGDLLELQQIAHGWGALLFRR